MKNFKRLFESLSIMTTFICCTYYSTAQNIFPSTGSAGIGTTTPNASSILDMVSTTKGMLVPRMTKTQRDAIASPAIGLFIYQTNSAPGFYYYTGTAWTAVTPKSKGWAVTGNSGIDPALNFVGTTDLQPLKFRINNIPAGELNPVNGNTAFGIKTLFSNTTGYSNVAIGTNALYSNSIRHNIVAVGDSALFNNDIGAPVSIFATANTALGSKAMYSNTTGWDNTATGFQALYSNTTGTYNTGNGYQALYSNTTAGHNVANGTQALYGNTTGSDNTAMGYKALYFSTTGTSNTAIGSLTLQFNTGSYNTAIGGFALGSNSSGINNTANGYQSLYLNTTGHDNTASGYQSLYSNTSSSFNTANGYQSLYSSTSAANNTATGYQALYNSNNNDNTADGYRALYSNTGGAFNTGTGSSALYSNTTGFQNTAVGYSALGFNQSGSYNTAVGVGALDDNVSGSNNVAVGASAALNNTAGGNTVIGASALTYNTSGESNTAVGLNAMNDNTTGSYNTTLGAGTTNNNYSNATAIGVGASANANYKIVIGTVSNSNLTGGYGAWQQFSDGRFKENVQGNVPGLAFINKLRPVTYNLNAEKIDNFLGIKQRMDTSKDAKQKTGYLLRLKEISSKLQTGFIAQEVEATAKSIGYDFDGVHHPESDKDNFTIGYASFVVPLVKAVQELSKQNDTKDSAINNLQQQINELKIMVQSLTSSTKINGANSITFTGASLEQNTPNPFNQSTVVRYTLPAKFVSAQIIITDQAGKVLKQVSISSTGNGMLNIQAGSLAAGTYNYSLMIDGHLVDTKKMVLIQ